MLKLSRISSLPTFPTKTVFKIVIFRHELDLLQQKKGKDTIKLKVDKEYWEDIRDCEDNEKVEVAAAPLRAEEYLETWEKLVDMAKDM